MRKGLNHQKSFFGRGNVPQLLWEAVKLDQVCTKTALCTRYTIHGSVYQVHYAWLCVPGTQGKTAVCQNSRVPGTIYLASPSSPSERYIVQSDPTKAVFQVYTAPDNMIITIQGGRSEGWPGSNQTAALLSSLDITPHPIAKSRQNSHFDFFKAL